MSDEEIEQIPFRLHFRADSPFAAAERHAAEIAELTAERDEALAEVRRLRGLIREGEAGRGETDE